MRPFSPQAWRSLEGHSRACAPEAELRPVMARRRAAQTLANTGTADPRVPRLVASARAVRGPLRLRPTHTILQGTVSRGRASKSSHRRAPGAAVISVGHRAPPLQLRSHVEPPPFTPLAATASPQGKGLAGLDPIGSRAAFRTSTDAAAIRPRQASLQPLQTSLPPPPPRGAPSGLDRGHDLSAELKPHGTLPHLRRSFLRTPYPAPTRVQSRRSATRLLPRALLRRDPLHCARAVSFFEIHSFALQAAFSSSELTAAQSPG